MTHHEQRKALNTMSNQQLQRLLQAGLICLFGCWLCAMVNPAQARDLIIQNKRFVYKAEGKPLPEVLRDFAATQSMPVVVAEGVSGVVNASFDLAPQAFLKTISQAFGIVWYFDGVALYIYPSQMIQTQFFRLKGFSPETVLSTLKAFGLGDSQYPLKFQPGENLLVAFGPPRHIELVEAMVASLTEKDTEGNKPLVQVFALKHASAVDRKSDGEILPGVASTLRATFGSASGAPNVAATASAESTSSALDAMQRLQGTPEQQAASNKALQNAARLKVEPKKPPQAPVIRGQDASAGGDASLTFVADEGTNTIIARLPPRFVKTVADLIARLDMPSEMIEISATIIDISSDELAALGFDWRYQSASRQISIGPGAVATQPTSTDGGFNITTLLTNTGREFLSRIRALEAKGSARIVAQPKVLGAVNRSASLTDKRTASVRVAGNLDAQLFSVEAGTTLQVVPRLIADGEYSKIGLDLFIEDGGFTSQSVDQIPVVQRTTVRTDAVLNEGQSLLVGGITVETKTLGTSGIPGLSRIPILGALFRTDEKSSQRRERIFLLTPKRISQDRLAGNGVNTDQNAGRQQKQMRMDNATAEKPEQPAMQQQSDASEQAVTKQPPANQIAPQDQQYLR